MKKSTLLPLALCLSTPVSADVLISQYVEGSSYNKALELYNTTSQPLSLTGYTLSVYSNGQTDASAIITLEGTVDANATWVIADNRSDTALSQFAQQLTSQNLFNGDDAVVLTKDGVVVDSLGQVGFRPDPQWGTSPVSTKDNTLVRKPTVHTGDTDPFDVFAPAQEYTGLAKDDFSGLGEHTLSDDAEPGDSDGIPEGVCTNCPALDKVADAATFDAEAYYAAVQSQIEAGYDMATIRATLSDVIAADQRQLTYSQVWSALTATDQDPANPDNIILFYSNRSLAKSSNGSGAASTNPDNWNREHSWPKSHGFSSSATEAYTDIQHLRPTDISVNASRGNLDFDFSDSPLAEAPDNRIDGDSFEPRDDIKGDVARMMMYMDVRYEGMGNDITPDLSLVNRITDSGSPELGKLCTLIEWHNADPVDASEQTRQHAIYEYQGNRNPFVDNPDWVSMFYDADSCDDTTPTEPEEPVEPELPTAAPLVLSAVFDGPLSGGVPKGIELYVAQDIADLSVCGVGSANNGNGSSGEEFVFPSVSANAGDYLYIASESTGFTNFFGFAPDYTSGAMSINGDDAIEVFCNGDRIDLYGETDVDGSGQAWEYADSFAYRTAGVPDGEFSADDWMIPGKDTLDGQADNATAVTPIPVGTYSLSPAQPFFSEYVEGGSYNKALEIVNLGSATLSLADYAVQVFANGSENGNTPITLSGDLAPGDVFVLANNQSDAPVTSVADMLTSQVSFNGDDAVVLLHNGEIIDAIGQIGVRTEWGSGDTSTKDNTLRRKSSVSAGDANAFDAFDPAVQWDGFAKNTFDGLGQYGNGDNGGDPEQPSACYAPATLIHEVQGDSFSSPLAGQTVEVEAVITHITPDLSGFFIQEEDQDADTNPATSGGVFVYAPGDNSALMAGDVVRFTASVSERYGRTQLSVQSTPQVCGTDSVSAVSLSLPVNDEADFEAVEGMLISNQSDWVINNVYSYSQYGEVTVSSKRLFIPTQLFAPDSEQADALAAANARDRLIIDDNADGSGNSQYLLGAGGIDPYNPIRLGDKVSQVVGVMDYGFSNYRVRPLGLVDVVKENARTDEPELVEGNLTLASFNVLNLFNGNGQGEGFPTSRGADTVAEYERQLEKIVSAMLELNADAIGLMEIENDGFGPLSMIAQLTDALNQQTGADVYAFVDAGVDTIGTDDITTGLLYRKDRVAPVGKAKILTPQNSISDENGPLFTDRNRPALTQRFTHKNTNREFVISVNHLKSKGSSCGAGDDDPLAGNCDVTRTRAAIALNTWLEAQYADVSKVIMGDMNAYAQENPITYLTSSGYTNTLEQVDGKKVYTYTFRGESGTLDYQLVSGTMKEALTDATAWHINADEMPAVDYNSEYKPDAWLNTLLYRASDHDPVVTSFNLTLLGDMDGDGDVDTSDFRLFIKAVLFKQPVDPELDLNNDGRVNNKDVRFFRDLCTRKGCKREDRGRGRAKVSSLRSLFN